MDKVSLSFSRILATIIEKEELKKSDSKTETQKESD